MVLTLVFLSGCSGSGGRSDGSGMPYSYAADSGEVRPEVTSTALEGSYGDGKLSNGAPCDCDGGKIPCYLCGGTGTRG